MKVNWVNVVFSGIVQTDSKPNYNFSTPTINRQRNNNGPRAEQSPAERRRLFIIGGRIVSRFFSCGPDNSIKFAALLFGFKFGA